MIRTAPIVFTARTDAWRTLLAALGLDCALDTPGWVVMRAGHGVVNLHEADEAGLEFWLEADDAPALAGQMRQRGHGVDDVDLVGVGTVHRAHLADGSMIGLSPAQPLAPTSTADQRLSVMPLLVTPDVEAVAGELVALGATRRLTSEAGQWADLSLDEGLVGVHAGAPAPVLSLEYDGDVQELADRLEASGLTARVIDEAYGRTLRVDHPDGAEEIWVNQRQQDLYGYRQG